MSKDDQKEERVANWFRRLSERHRKDNDSLEIALVTYGSLLHPQEIETLFRHPERVVKPVRVEGFERRFSKSVAPHLRKTEGKQSGVLNLHRGDNWFNGLLVGPLTVNGLRKYAFREREYNLTQIEDSSIGFYSGKSPNINSFEGVYTCLLDTEDQQEDFEPHPEYLDLCLEGANSWSHRFYKDFTERTYFSDNKLKKYLDK